MLRVFGFQDPALEDPDKVPEDPAERQRRQELVRALEERIASRPVAFWLEQFEARGVPCAPVRDLRALYQDPQARANRLLTLLQQPGVGPVWVLGSLWRLNGQPNPIGSSIPSIGGLAAVSLSGGEDHHGDRGAFS
jgi:crotonobetainyl-CoA:carnitine CoA-transferase CaiB-like acyl-CoA transferase